MSNIKVGAQVKAAFESINHNALTISFGKVVSFGCPIGNSSEQVVEVMV